MSTMQDEAEQWSGGKKAGENGVEDLPQPRHRRHDGTMNFADVEHEVQMAVGRGVFPGAVLLVREGTHVFYLRAFGHRSIEPTPTPMSEDTIFDLSSLTKPFATSVAMMLMVRDGRVRLDDRVTRFFHNFGVHGKTHVTFRHLLSHCSGLPAWRPYHREILDVEHHEGRINFLGSDGAKSYVYQSILRERLESPPGTRTVYSDLGFMLLGAVIEEIAGVNLDRFCQSRIFRPLGLRSTAFVDLSLLRHRRLEPVTDMIAPTERCPWRKHVLCGVVHDDNAYAMGGVSGHAGLFSSAKDLDTILCRLKESYWSGSQMIPQPVIREFWSRDATVADSTWCLGWDSPSAVGSSAGSRFSPNSVGHLGFTGTSVWLDIERDRHVILLTNRVHPSRGNEAIREFRPRIHDLIVEALEQA
jgi:CubicO group peptidase (beta-lactamase class C family)